MKKTTLLILFTISIVYSAKSQTVRDSTILKGDSVSLKEDSSAHFIGGEKAWKNFLGRNWIISVGAENGARNGKYNVIIEFTIDVDGNLTDIKPRTNYGYGMEQECIRVLLLSPKWIPAVVNGKPVPTIHQQPFTYVIQGQ